MGQQEKQEQQLRKRIEELAARSAKRSVYTYTEFLNLAEQDLLVRCVLPTDSAPYRLWGGFDGAERKIACFGDEDHCGYVEEPPIVCLCIAPLQPKFADTLTHRDFLGTLMALGIRREVLGDIVLSDNCGYLFCLENMASYLVEQVTKVKHTAVRCSLTEPPELVCREPEITYINVASERLDAIVAAVYSLSRSESQVLFSKGIVFTDSRMVMNTSLEPAPGTMISVRGKGRFRYEGVARETRKGRLQVAVRVY